MSETRDQGTATQELQRRLRVDNGNLYRPQGQASVKRARGSADWGQRCKAALFVLLLLLIANALVADLLVARSLLGWHG